MKHARGPLYILLVIGIISSGCDKEENGTDSLLMAGINPLNAINQGEDK